MKTPVEIITLALEIRANLIDSGELDHEGDSLECWDIVLDRSKKRAGLCKIKDKTVSLSLPLFEQEANFLSNLRNTVLHEFAHAIAGIVLVHGRYDIHGWRWKSIMIRIGGDPARCHSMLTPTVKRRLKISLKHTVHCGRCRKPVLMGSTVYRRMTGPEKLSYKHARCGGPLLLQLIPLKRLEGIG